MLERNVALREDSHKLHEPEVETKPQYTFTAISDGREGLAVISKGQPESAVRDLPTRPIALTLYRGFARTVAAEGEEGGQELGRTTHDYWIVPLRGAVQPVALTRLGQRIGAGLDCIYTRANRLPRMNTTPVLPATGSWYRLNGGPMVVTACKRAEDGHGLVLRLYNPTAKKATQRIEFCAAVAAAQRANMLEKAEKELTPDGKQVTLTARGKEIVTLRVELKPLGKPARKGSRRGGGKR